MENKLSNRLLDNCRGDITSPCSIGLLFYHTKLHRHVAVEVYPENFQPEMAGRLQFLLSALDNKECTSIDERSVGLILCRDHNRMMVEYTLAQVGAPMGVARYVTPPPQEVVDMLPTADDMAEIIECMDAELAADPDEGPDQGDGDELPPMSELRSPGSSLA